MVVLQWGDVMSFKELQKTLMVFLMRDFEKMRFKMMGFKVEMILK